MKVWSCNSTTGGSMMSYNSSCPVKYFVNVLIILACVVLNPTSLVCAVFDFFLRYYFMYTTI